MDHPHVASTYASGKIDGVYFIAMEYIPGKSLQRLVQAEGPLAVPRAARLLGEVAAGLEHAHSQGLIHRDLKPSNILVTPHDHAKVLDLGLAMIEGEDVADIRVVGGKGYIVGTMDYIAPEQTANSAAVDRRADIYSLGCTLYYAIIGRPPFPGGTSKEKMERQRSQEPESLLDLKPTLPVAFVLLITPTDGERPGRPAGDRGGGRLVCSDRGRTMPCCRWTARTTRNTRPPFTHLQVGTDARGQRDRSDGTRRVRTTSRRSYDRPTVPTGEFVHPRQPGRSSRAGSPAGNWHSTLLRRAARGAASDGDPGRCSCCW